MNRSNLPLNYKDAGVNIDAGHALIERIKPIAKKTQQPGVMAGLGGFGGCFQLPSGYNEPVLVSGTDGVGTKLKLAIEQKRHGGIGIDLVAMCANDLLVCGAKPLFFLDYYATGELHIDVAEAVINSIGQGCVQAGAALIGGETAEMPGMYQKGDYDLAGFCVGIAEKSQLIDGSKHIQAEDAIIALASSGPHANGYSLIRKILDTRQVDLQQTLGKQSLIDALLMPTRIYVSSILATLQEPDFDIHGLCHITGGGFYENIPRILPPTLCAVIDQHSWQQKDVFNWLQTSGCITDHEMYRTFNCGVGFMLVAPQKQANHLVDFLNRQGESAWVIGHIDRSENASSDSVIFK